MGLFDTVHLHPSLLPPLVLGGRTLPVPANHWQTKDLGEGMSVYRITEQGVVEVERYRQANPPPEGWPKPWIFGSYSDAHAPRQEAAGWGPSTLTALFAIYHTIDDDEARHPRFPDARREWGVTLACVAVDGRVRLPLVVQETDEQWSEPCPGGDGATRRLEEDPIRRAARDDRDKLGALRARIAAMRSTPHQRMLALLRLHLDHRSFRQAARLLREITDD
jgi:hypothetical protein